MDARKAEAAQLIYDKYIQIGRQHIIILPPYFYHCKLVIVLQYLLKKNLKISLLLLKKLF